jgi:hypothetical protein
MKSNKLEDLGVPYENSIMDGYAALVQADIERKNLKDEAVKERVDGIKDAESELTELKSIEQQTTTNEIYMITQKIAISTEMSDLNRQLTVDVLSEAAKDLAEENRMNDQYEHDANLRSQESLNSVEERSRMDYSVRENVYTENTDILTNYTAAYAEELRKQNELEEVMSVNADQKLIAVQEYMQSESNDNFEERKATERAVNKVVIDAAELDAEIYEAKGKELLGNKEELVKIDDLVAAKAENDAKHAPANKESLKVVENAVVQSERVKSEQQMIHAADVFGKVENVNISISENSIQRDLNRQKTTSVINDGHNSIQQTAYADYANETVKYLQTQNAITTEVEKESGVVQMENEKQAQNVSSIELLDKKATTAYTDNSLSDDEERLRARSAVDIINTNVEENTKNSTEKQEENALKLDDVSKAIDAGITNIEGVQKEKHYDAQAKLNTIESKQPEKVKLANSLGQDYPEGVSQESFTQNDENGLMKAVITRRVVVIEGHGDVYVRTQTLQAITYTKNGQPTTEMVWQKETQGPNLERHY